MPVERNQKIFLVSVCILLFLAYGTLVLTKPIAQDEGIFLTIGKYLNQGQLPYQDFFDHKPPAIYFLFAGLFKLFGTNVFVVKIALLLSVLGSSVLVIKIGEILKKGTGLIAASIFLFLMTQFEGDFLIAEPFLLLPLLLCLWLLLRFKQDSPWLILAGSALMVAMMFKQTVLLSAIPLLVLALRSTKKRILFFGTGLMLPLVTVGTYLGANGIVAQAWHQVVTLTLTSYPRESIWSVVQFLDGYFLWTLPVWILFLFGVRIHVVHKVHLWALVLLPLPVMFFRHYPHYWVQILPFVALIVSIELIQRRHSRVLTILTLSFCLLIAGGKVVQDAGPNMQLLREQLQAAQILSLEPADSVLAENQFTAFYFLSPQRPLNKFLYLTEITEGEQAEQQTIDDLKKSQSVLVLWPDDDNFAYAKKLQAFLDESQTEAKSSTVPPGGTGAWEMDFSRLGMRVMRYEPVTHAPANGAGLTSQ